MPASLTLQQIASLKRGDDIFDEEGNILYKNIEYTLSPRRSRSYAYCSDTAYHDKMIDQINGVNLLYHEATFTEDEISKARETFHSTARQAATIAQKANADKLLLGHFSARYRELDPILDEAKEVFDNCELAVEGMEFTIQE
jgi:ribonuclease Z